MTDETTLDVSVSMQWTEEFDEDMSDHLDEEGIQMYESDLKKRLRLTVPDRFRDDVTDVGVEVSVSERSEDNERQ